MNKVFVVSNQNGLYASKHKEWIDGRDAKLLFRSAHHDEALNLVFELSSKDIYLRAIALSTSLDERTQPIVEVTAPNLELELDVESALKAKPAPETVIASEPALELASIPDDENNQ